MNDGATQAGPEPLLPPVGNRVWKWSCPSFHHENHGGEPGPILRLIVPDLQLNCLGRIKTEDYGSILILDDAEPKGPRPESFMDHFEDFILVQWFRLVWQKAQVVECRMGDGHDSGC
ncbi:MAG: hypothetical protein H6963_11620 [Chromatiaceae bacterium]|nr:hypothetical protein [Chromatiaceae bacterium]